MKKKNSQMINLFLNLLIFIKILSIKNSTILDHTKFSRKKKWNKKKRKKECIEWTGL